MSKLTFRYSRRIFSCPVQPRACHWSCVFWRNFSGVKLTWSCQLAARGVASVWSSRVRSPPVHDNLSVPLWVYMRFPVPENQNQTNKSVYTSTRAQFKLTHTGVETCAFQTGCQLSSAASGMSLELCFLTQFKWRDAHVLVNWQLADLPKSGGREFNPRRVHDVLWVPLWVYMLFPVSKHQN